MDMDWVNKQAWLPVDAPLTNGANARAPATYEEVCRQFDVTRTTRYLPYPNKNGGHTTFCNIYVWDVTRAMCCEIPHWVNGTSWEPTGKVGQGGKELDANDVIKWLMQVGPKYGWSKVSGDDAMARANLGHPVVVTFLNPTGIGHVAMMLPQGLIAQAGATNLWKAQLIKGFGRLPVEFWTHE